MGLRIGAWYPLQSPDRCRASLNPIERDAPDHFPLLIGFVDRSITPQRWQEEVYVKLQKVRETPFQPP